MKRLIIFCLMLAVVAALSVPASATSTITLGTPLKVDIGGTTDGVPSTPQFGWRDWQIANSWTGLISTTFNMGGGAGENPGAELDAYREWQSPSNTGGSRNRSGGFAFVAGTNEFSPTTKGFGMNYIKLTLTQLDANTKYKFYLWSFEATNVWTIDGNNPNSKYAAWSTTNPKQWLDDHGWGQGGANTSEPNGGYGPKTQTVPPGPITESNMPAGLAEFVLACGAEGGRTSMIAPTNDNNNYVGYMDRYVTSFYATTDNEGAIALYGWIDPTDWSGSMHIPINGFMVVPEPATVALLGLGALSLIRRKK